jgi:4-amino-4-deoxy-L-arabinose transferase-like glycosyltransferase
LSDFDERRRIALALGVLALALTAVRLWIASRLGLAPDEAYYWTWSRDLAFVHRDHPPLIAFAIALGTRVADGELGVRLPAILCGALAVPLTYLASRAVGLDGRGAVLASALAALLPISSAGAIIATPDSLLGVAWILGGLSLARLAAGGDARHWILFGLALGAGLWAKHSALLLLVAAAASASFAPKLRASIRTLGFLLGAALCALVAAPYLLRELASGAPSFSFQLDHLRGALPSGDPGGLAAIPGRLGELVAGQVGLLTPPIAALLALSFGAPSRETPGLRVAQIAALVPMAAAALAALGAHPEQNWASLGHPFAAIAAVAAAEARFAGTPRVAWKWTSLAVVLGASISIHVHAIAPFLPLPPDRDPVSRLHGWADLEKLRDLDRGARAIVCDNYGLASELLWARRGGSGVPPISSSDRFAAAPPPGRWLLLDEDADYGRAGLSSARCAAVRPLGAIELHRADGAVVRRVRAYDGEGCGRGPIGRGAE